MRKSVRSFSSLGELREELARKAKARQDAERQSREEVPEKNCADDDLFRTAMADVREIKEFREIPYKRQPPKEPCKRPRDDDIEILRQIVRGERKIRLSDTGEYIQWNSPDMPGDTAPRLHRGEFSVQDFIDLHGMTVDQAEAALTAFLKDARARRLYCVKIIHGRGLRSPKGPVLKEALVNWLQGVFRRYVHAYATARDCDGGLGATYVILKARQAGR